MDCGATLEKPLHHEVPRFQKRWGATGELQKRHHHPPPPYNVGVKIELLGQIELYFDRGNTYDFVSLVRELDAPGDLYEPR